MKVLVVGGTGLIGGDIALYLTSQGHEVTIMARKPSAAPSLAALPFMRGDYVNDTFSDEHLSGFDGLVFAAAAVKAPTISGLCLKLDNCCKQPLLS